MRAGTKWAFPHRNATDCAALASEHDFGIVDNDENLDLEMPEAIGKGNPGCRLIFTMNQ